MQNTNVLEIVGKSAVIDIAWYKKKGKELGLPALIAAKEKKTQTLLW